MDIHFYLLGSTRAELVFDSQKTPVLIRGYDMLPYGELLQNRSMFPETNLFTFGQRDQSTLLDAFTFRFLQNDIGRWQSPDPIFTSALNLYVYGVCNPVLVHREMDIGGRKESTFD